MLAYRCRSPTPRLRPPLVVFSAFVFVFLFFAVAARQVFLHKLSQLVHLPPTIIFSERFRLLCFVLFRSCVIVGAASRAVFAHDATAAVVLLVPPPLCRCLYRYCIMKDCRFSLPIFFVIRMFGWWLRGMPLHMPLLLGVTAAPGSCYSTSNAGTGATVLSYIVEFCLLPSAFVRGGSGACCLWP